MTVEALKVVACRRAQVAVGDGSSATVKRAAAAAAAACVWIQCSTPAFERAPI